MPPPGVVLDTNVVISAHLNAEGYERFALDLALTRRVRLYVSPEVLDEYQAVLNREKFDLDPNLVALSMRRIRTSAQIVEPRARVHISVDSDDNKFLELSQEVAANYLVTGNKRHFPKTWKSTSVVNARELLQVLVPHLTRLTGKLR